MLDGLLIRQGYGHLEAALLVTVHAGGELAPEGFGQLPVGGGGLLGGEDFPKERKSGVEQLSPGSGQLLFADQGGGFGFGFLALAFVDGGERSGVKELFEAPFQLFDAAYQVDGGDVRVRIRTARASSCLPARVASRFSSRVASVTSR